MIKSNEKRSAKKRPARVCRRRIERARRSEVTSKYRPGKTGRRASGQNARKKKNLYGQPPPSPPVERSVAIKTAAAVPVFGGAALASLPARRRRRRRRHSTFDDDGRVNVCAPPSPPPPLAEPRARAGRRCLCACGTAAVSSLPIGMRCACRPSAV